jgi:hypothetical protein
MRASGQRRRCSGHGAGMEESGRNERVVRNEGIKMNEGRRETCKREAGDGNGRWADEMS